MPGKEEEKGVRGKGKRWFREVRRAGWGYKRLWLRFGMEEVGATVGCWWRGKRGHLSTSAEKAGS